MSHSAHEKAEAHARRLREDIRHFCAHTMPADLRRKSARHQVLDKADYLQWMRLLQGQGWVVGHWPEEHGGAGWSALERFVFEDELARHGCPWVIPFGVKYVGPVIYTYGSEAQKQRFLPRIVSSEEFWAQGYSEPGAGSDLAAGGAHATPPRCAPRRRATAITMWSTARRSGPPMRSGPTGCSAWCARTARPARRTASPSC
jgi:alkylation response protein AidB-like acyl-CoA dehydrogenase